MSQRLLLQFAHANKRIPIHHDLVAGRSRSRCDLVLPEYFPGRTEFISATHFKISRWANGQHVIMDLDSSNGTWRNGERLAAFQDYKLFNHDVIQVTSNKLFRIHVLIHELSSLEDDDVTRESNTSTVIQSRPNLRLGIQFDESDQTFVVDDQTIPDHHLNPQERDLLLLLYNNRGTVCTYHEIERTVWGIPVERNTLTQKVKSLRNKLNAIVPQSGHNYIQSVYGMGYKYDSPF